MKRTPTGEITMSQLSPELYEDIKKAYRQDVSDSYIPDIKIQGRTLANLLGRAGCSIYKSPEVLEHAALLSFAEGGFKLTSNTLHGDNKYSSALGFHNLNFEVGKKYIAVSDIIDNPSNKSLWWYVHGATSFETKSCYIYSQDNGHKVSNRVTYRTYEITDASQTAASVGIYERDSADDYAILENCRIYEISEAEFNELETLTPDEVAKKYPYVDDVKAIVNPYIESSENLLQPSFHIGGFNFANNMALPWYAASYSDSHYVCSSYPIELEPGIYTLSTEIDDKNVVVYMHIGNNAIEAASANHFNEIVVTERTYGTIVLVNSVELSNASAKKIVEKLQNGEYRVVVTKGKGKKKYSECTNSRISFDTTLYDGEAIYKLSDGTFVKNSIWEEFIIDPINNDYSFAVAQMTNGMHRIQINNLCVRDLHTLSVPIRDGLLVRYDGKIITEEDSGTDIRAEHFHIGGPSYTTHSLKHCILIDIPDKLSGWGPNYVPTFEEIQAYFLGWRICPVAADGTSGQWDQLYNDPTSATLKQWAKIWCGVGDKSYVTSNSGLCDVVTGSSTTSYPTKMNDKGYTPYRLLYRKEVPTTEIVKTHGSLTITKNSQINHGSGLVLNELFNPFKVTYHIRSGRNQTNRRIEKVIEIRNNENHKISFDINYYLGHYRILFGHIAALMHESKKENEVFADYLIYYADTVSDFDYELTKQDNMEQLLLAQNNRISQCMKAVEQNSRDIDTIMNLYKQPNPNLLINSDFQVWQRGTEFADINGKYSADRWYVQAHLSKGVKIQKINEGLKMSAIVNNSSTPDHGAYVEIKQPMENNMKGKVTLSIRARGFGIMSFFLYYDNSSHYSNIHRENLNKTWQTYSFTIDIESLRQVIPTFRVEGYTQDLEVWMDIDWIKMEYGAEATEYVPKTHMQELTECQRYYQRVNIVGRATTIYPNTIQFIHSLPVTMRKMPSIIHDATTDTEIVNVINGTSNQKGFTVSGNAMNESVVYIQLDKTAHGLSDCYFRNATCNIYADAEIY